MDTRPTYQESSAKLLEEQSALLAYEAASIEERAVAAVNVEFLEQNRLDVAIEYLETHFPPSKRQVIILVALQKRLKYISEEKEKEYVAYTKHKDYKKTDKQIAFLSRMEEQIKAEYAHVKVFPIENYVTEIDLSEIKRIGFTQFMVSPAHFLSTYENGVFSAKDATIDS